MTGLAPATLAVDLQALRRNYRALCAAARPGRCGAVVKADAYGLGADAVAGALWQEGCRDFFVATPEEGVALRSRLTGGRAYVLNGVGPGWEREFLRHRLRPVLNSPREIRRWAGCAAAAGRRLACAVHVDTGMGRLGLAPTDLVALSKDAGTWAGLDPQLLMTHFACADDPQHPLTREQIRRFGIARRMLPRAPSSLGNSAATLTGGHLAGDLARPGIALFGGNPFSDHDGSLEPVATLEAEILQLRDVAAGSSLGYRASYIARHGMRVAVVGAGYADGVPWRLGNAGQVGWRGFRFPIVGAVSMDTITVDVSSSPGSLLQPGERVEIFGQKLPLESVARTAATIGYEILTGVGRRVGRTYFDATAG